MLELGIKCERTMTVREEDTAISMCSGAMHVLATPVMICLMEETAFLSVNDKLESGMGTVGTDVNIKHISPTPVGMEIRCESELVGINGRALTFSVKAYDKYGLIGEGTHERFIIDEKKFQQKCDQKSVSLTQI